MQLIAKIQIRKDKSMLSKYLENQEKLKSTIADNFEILDLKNSDLLVSVINAMIDVNTMQFAVVIQRETDKMKEELTKPKEEETNEKRIIQKWEEWK
jgi:hypothetical protein